jgi:pilus assembly protein CpaB
MLVQLATQPSSGNPSYATGADVSRFQRRSVPGKGEPAGFAAPSVAPAPVITAAPFPGGATASLGPVVRVARGNSVTAVSVAGKN